MFSNICVNFSQITLQLDIFSMSKLHQLRVYIQLFREWKKLGGKKQNTKIGEYRKKKTEKREYENPFPNSFPDSFEWVIE